MGMNCQRETHGTSILLAGLYQTFIKAVRYTLYFNNILQLGITHPWVGRQNVPSLTNELCNSAVITDNILGKWPTRWAMWGY